MAPEAPEDRDDDDFSITDDEQALQMRFELIQMGFPEQSVNRLLSLKKILSIEQAIDYFIKGP